MEKLGIFLIVVLVLLAVLVIGGGLTIGNLADRKTQQINAEAGLEYARGQARAAVIQAQGQARLDSAAATQAVMLAALPWGVLGILGLLGLGLLALLIVILVRQPPHPFSSRPTPQIIYLAHPGWYIESIDQRKELIDHEDRNHHQLNIVQEAICRR